VHFDRQLERYAFFEQQIFGAQFDRCRRSRQFERGVDAGEAFVDDVFVEQFLEEFRPRGRGRDAGQSARDRLWGFRQRIAVLSSEEFDFRACSFVAALKGDRIFDRHGFFAEGERAAAGHRVDAVGDRRSIQRTIAELGEFPSRMMRSRERCGGENHRRQRCRQPADDGLLTAVLQEPHVGPFRLIPGVIASRQSAPRRLPVLHGRVAAVRASL
jgi:hypothetical protein